MTNLDELIEEMDNLSPEQLLEVATFVEEQLLKLQKEIEE